MRKVKLNNNGGKITCEIDELLITDIDSYDITIHGQNVSKFTLSFIVPESCEFQMNTFD